MTAYYNEHEPYAAQWLRNLIAAGLIAPGDVDERSIEDVTPADVAGYRQCHFFAGIGVWSYALRQAGWSDDREVWTGSCPCQPFSAAGKGGGITDERHLWPAFHWLIQQCQPTVVFGEQVASPDGLNWLDHVSTDMENTGYACGTVDLCAAGVGAPHIRQRLFFVAEDRNTAAWHAALRLKDETRAELHAAAVNDPRRLGDAEHSRLEGHAWNGDEATGRAQQAGSTAEAGDAGGLADAMPTRRPEGWSGAGIGQIAGGGELGGLADADRAGSLAGCENAAPAGHGDTAIAAGCDAGHGQPGPTNGYWRAADWLFCRDGKWRPVKPGTFPLVNGAPARVGRLRAYGNAINAQAAQTFIEAYMECRP